MKHSQTMRNFILIWGVCLIFLFISSNASGMKDSILAVVNDEVITQNDLKDYMSSMYVQFQAEGRSPREIEMIMLDLEISGIERLIEDKLIISEAAKLELEIREEAIDERIEEIKKNYPSEQAFLDALVSHGSTITDVREKIKEQMQVRYVVESQVKSKIFVNPQEVTEYYRNNLDAFDKEETVVVDSIAINYGEDRDMAMLRAEEALGLIQKGTDFLEVAAEFSQLPSIGMVKRGQLLEEIEKVVFNLEEGEISPLIETEIGIFIFRVNEKNQAQHASLEEAKNFITNVLFQEKFKERYREWIENLKENAYVEIKK